MRQYFKTVKIRTDAEPPSTTVGMDTRLKYESSFSSLRLVFRSSSTRVIRILLALTDEFDTHGSEGVGELGLLRGMAPARPDGVHALLLRNLANHAHVGVVVRVLARGHL